MKFNSGMKGIKKTSMPSGPKINPPKAAGPKPKAPKMPAINKKKPELEY